MASKISALVPVLGLGTGVVGLILAVRQARAAEPPSVEIPTVGEIMAAESYVQLQAYYTLIGDLFTTGAITYDEYMALYDAYYARWYQLARSS